MRTRSYVRRGVKVRAKANRLDPYAWMRLLMRELPAARSLEDYEALLPWNLRHDRLSIPFRG
jgi:hypothetical protein